MRRDGEFKHHNLNRDLLDPLTTKIENPWAETFSDSPLFTDLTPAVMRHLSTLVTQIAHSAPPGLKDTIMAQGEWVEQSITLAMRAILKSLRGVVSWEQGQISRGMTEKMKRGMKGGYEKAEREVGKGCTKRRKVCALTICCTLRRTADELNLLV